MDLDFWAQYWGIPSQALNELKNIFRIDTTKENKNNNESLSESAIQNKIRLEASRKGCLLWRNNVGATHTQSGSFIRYGLANESTHVNQLIKSSDLIGVKPVLITPIMVGSTIGQFLCREVKKEGWKYAGNEREVAQLNWLRLISSMGGNACFATSDDTI